MSGYGPSAGCGPPHPDAFRGPTSPRRERRNPPPGLSSIAPCLDVSKSRGCLDLNLRCHRKQIRLAMDRPGLVFLARGNHGREEAAVMHGGAEPVECRKMLRHAVTLVLFEAVARAILGQ